MSADEQSQPDADLGLAAGALGYLGGLAVFLNRVAQHAIEGCSVEVAQAEARGTARAVCNEVGEMFAEAPFKAGDSHIVIGSGEEPQGIIATLNMHVGLRGEVILEGHFAGPTNDDPETVEAMHAFIASWIETMGDATQNVQRSGPSLDSMPDATD